MSASAGQFNRAVLPLPIWPWRRAWFDKLTMRDVVDFMWLPFGKFTVRDMVDFMWLPVDRLTMREVVGFTWLLFGKFTVREVG